MKFKDLKPLRFSVTGDVQLAVVYDGANRKDLVDGCSVEYAIEHFADTEIIRIQAMDSKIVFYVETED